MIPTVQYARTLDCHVGPWDRTAVKILCCPACGLTPLNQATRAVCANPRCGRKHIWEVPRNGTGEVDIIESPMAWLEVPIRPAAPEVPLIELVAPTRLRAVH